MPRIHPVILSGGSGSRLWPLSRESYPKQLQRLTSKRSLLQEAVLRAQVWAAPIIVASDQHRFIVAEQLREIEISPRALVIEPVGRNTAPAATIAALLLQDHEDDDFLLILPSDHLIRSVTNFQSAVNRAAALSPARLTCFGVEPTSPSSAYGYVEKGPELASGIFQVARFVEKPTTAAALSFLDQGRYCWNAGIFLFPVRQFLELLGRTRPAMLTQCQAAVAGAHRDLDFLRVAPEPFAAIDPDSIDYAIMEQVKNAAIADLDAGWTDVGSWSALHLETERDHAENAMIGDVVAVDCRGSYLRSERRLLTAIGVENLIVIAAEDVVLVADRTRDQQIKALVQTLKTQQRKEATQGVRDWRPWGWFETLETGDRFLVKRLVVNPGGGLSLQLHRRRSEHWVVVQGVAEVTRGEEIFVVHENESAFIPIGTPHRLRNPGDQPLYVIEV